MTNIKKNNDNTTKGHEKALKSITVNPKDWNKCIFHGNINIDERHQPLISIAFTSNTFSSWFSSSYETKEPKAKQAAEVICTYTKSLDAQLFPTIH